MFIKRLSLEEATKSAPNEMGCYKLYHDDLIKYVGKAEDGLRKRFVQHYNGTTIKDKECSSAKKIYDHRDEITVMWRKCTTKNQCKQIESEWIRDLHPEWNVQSGHGDKGVFQQDDIDIAEELSLD